MPQTDKTQKTRTVIIPNEKLLDRLDDLTESLQVLGDRLVQQARPIPAKAKGAPIEIDLETKRQLAIKAQFFGLKNPDALAQVVLHAFLDLCEEDCWITFPLMLQQVPVGDQ